MPNIVSLDLETTGLVPGVHEVWEVGIVPLNSGRDHIHYQFKPTALEAAEPEALAVGRFYERYEWISDPVFSRNMLINAVIVEEDEDTGDKTESPSDKKAFMMAQESCWEIAKTLEGATLMGLNVGSFDAVFLAELLRKYGHSPTWSHRYLELGSFAAGAWGAKAPLSGKAISDRLEKSGVENRGVHNAYNDALWNVDAYNFIRERTAA